MHLWAGGFGLVLLLASRLAGAEPLAVEEVAPGIFVHVGRLEDFTPGNAGGIANLAFVVGGRSVAVIDTGGSLIEGQGLREAVRQRTSLPISHVINTHVHPDHIFGNAAFQPDGPAFVGHVNLPRHLAEAGPLYLASMDRLLGSAAAGTLIVPPTLLVQDELSIDLGGRELRLHAWRTAHTDTDLTVQDPATRTLFAGDLVFMERLPVVDGSLRGWLAALEILAGIDAARVVPGHGPASAPWPAALQAERSYLTGLQSAVRGELARNRSLEEAVREVLVPAGQHWRLAGQNHERNVTASYTELEWE